MCSVSEARQPAAQSVTSPQPLTSGLQLPVSIASGLKHAMQLPVAVVEQEQRHPAGHQLGSALWQLHPHSSTACDQAHAPLCDVLHIHPVRSGQAEQIVAHALVEGVMVAACT